MASPGYVVGTAGTAIAITAAATKTVFNIISGANATPIITELAVSFDGTSASTGKLAVQICQSTQATAGTAGSSPTPTQIRGRSRGAQSTAGINYSAEPTALTVVKEWFVDATSGIVLQHPLGRETEADTSGNTVKALAVRIVSFTGQTPNLRGYVEFEEG